MSKIPLTLAISHYDHVTELVSGRVPVEGVELTALNLQIEEIFYRMFNHLDFDASEVSMGKFSSLASQGNSPFVGIPVFPSRVPRHSSIYVRKDGGVKQPSDLKGKRIGIPEWAQTASVYSRGLLQHEYGVDLKSIEWIQAGVDQPGRLEKVKLTCRPESTIAPPSTRVSAACSSRARSMPRCRRIRRSASRKAIRTSR